MKKNFIVEMDDALTCRHSKFMYAIGKGCTALYSGDFHECDGNLNERPEWCPLIPVKNVISSLEISTGKKVWVDE